MTNEGALVLKQDRIEWPTIALAILIYGCWLAVTWCHALLPLCLTPVLGGWLIAWHNSLQHETIHRHPTGRRLIDGAIGAVPLSLWLPYSTYFRTHRAHHASRAITDPFEDPESRYLAHTQGGWGHILRAAEFLQSTLLGRLLLGPPITVGRFLVSELARGRKDPATLLRNWLPHLGASALVVAWLHLCGLGIGAYLLLFVYPGISLSLLRSFAEHRPAEAPEHRVAIVETRGPLGLLFLHNNLHAAHHELPGLAWYRLPAFYRQHRMRLLEANGGLLYRSYGELFRRFLFRPHDHLVHPDYGGHDTSPEIA
ncbi:fatty acid desaturase [Sphingomonas sp.]|uniref:fatty acid desaturase n=1 Tax=Sphingomonas sp. TaxID=28214 RepID=UPI002D1FB5F5|nr:fatty acid desaturase [Sphingomonas sp.]